YRVRAGNHWVVRGNVSGFRHTVSAAPAADGSFRCVRDCSPWRPQAQGRVFEVSTTTAACPALDTVEPDELLPAGCAVGQTTEEDLVCSYDAALGPVRPGGAASECIYDGLTSRFVMYRGLSPTTRDMSYAFDVVGGFAALGISLTGNTSFILPVSLNPIPGFDMLAVVDSQDRGLMLVSLRGVGVQASFF